MSEDTKTEQGHASYCPAGCMPADEDRGNCSFLMSAYILAGLSMMLNIRLSYSSAPYALIRFKLPENLFSVFVRRMASSLELWCLPGFIIADAMELAIKLVIGTDFSKFNTLASKELKFKWIIFPSIIAQWLNFITYVILLIVYLAGDDQGHLTRFYWVIAVSGFVFGINNVFVFAADYNYIPIYMVGENCFPALTSFIHYITTLSFGNRRKYDSDFIIVYIDIFVAIIISFVAAMVWTAAYGFCTYSGPFNGKITYTTPKDIKNIIVTGINITPNTEAKTINIKTGKVTIKAYTKDNVEGGQCTDAANTATTDLTASAPLTITPTKDDNKITLTIDIDVTKPDNALDALNALADTTGTGTVPCNVKVEDNTLTIEPGAVKDGDGKCKFIDIEITPIGDALTTDLASLGLTSGTKATVSVAPPPNQLTIKYKNNSVEKKGPVTIPEDINIQDKGITEITKAMADKIKATATAPNAETYYKVTDDTKKITYGFKLTEQPTTDATIKEANASIIVDYGHIFAEGFSGTYANPYMISPLLIVLVGMGLVYAIYPGIAPGMIVPFYLIDKIEMVLLIATIFPPVIIALLQKFKPNWSPKTEFLLYSDGGFKFGGWEQYNANDFSKGAPQKGDPVHAYLWHLFDLLIVTMIILAYIFIYSLHYRDSKLSRSIVNQPKMSTALTIIFYMCHEISLAVGFPGMVANAAEYTVLAQMVGAFLMVFLALYSEGYIIEYKSHDPAHWPTEGMTKWNAFCYWCKRASKITNHNLRSLFTTDLRRDLLLCIQKNELI